jgi:plastocyanin
MLHLPVFVRCLLLLFVACQLHGQNVSPQCGSNAYAQTLGSQRLRHQQTLDAALTERLAQGAFRTSSLPTIPIVVHVIHQGGPENISAAQVQTAISQLNAAFANTGPYTHPGGVNTGLTFCLAVRDPNGVFTTGINRISSPLTQVTLETQDAALKALSLWDPTRYLNVWVVAGITSVSMGAAVAGYASFPSGHGSPTDGIVIEAPFLGGSPDDTKVMVHEVGHYLGLYHTFEGGCANANCLQDGDKVCDTPPDGSSAGAQCSSPPNTCTTDDQDPSSQNPFRAIGLGGLGDQPDPTWNYMDYGYQVCQVRLSQGQSTRMAAFLTGARASLATSLGCQTPCSSPVVAAFNPAVNTTLNIGASLTFTNASTGASSYAWTVNGIPFSSSASPTYTFNQTGTFEVQLLASNGQAGCADSVAIRVTVQCTMQANFSANDTEVQPGDTVTFTQQTPGAQSYTWLLDGVAVQTGPSYSHTFSTLGGQSVCLVTFNGTCRDTACTYIAVGDCGRKRNNIWAFGSNVNGLDFNAGGVPVAKLYSQNGGNEGCSSICNADGQLELYCNGSYVYRSNAAFPNGNVLPNGDSLWGGSAQSSTQGSIIIPKPLDDSIFYVFTVDETGGYFFNTYGGLAYSVVDLRAGSYGDVVQKNVPLFRRATEKLCAVRHANGCDIWVLAHGYNTDSTAFRAYRLTPNGVDTNAVISRVGFPHYKGVRLISNPNYNSQGQMKFSPDGTQIALVIPDTHVVEILNFDKSTGIVSNPITLQDTVFNTPFGVEFSGDGSQLYIGDYRIRSRLYQLNPKAGNAAAIMATRTLLLTDLSQPLSFLNLQRGPDGKIYLSRFQGTQLGVVHQPNLPGIACNASLAGPYVYFAMSFSLQNCLSDYSLTARPQAHGPLQVCQGSTGLSYYFDQYSCADSVTWSLPVGPVVTANTNGALSVDFPVAGTFTFIVDAFSACGNGRDTLVVTCTPFTLPQLGPDRPLCAGSTITLNPGGGYTSYLWNNGATTPTRTVNQAGTYWVRVGNGTCFAIDTIVVSAPVPVQPQLGPDASICPGGIRPLSPGPGFVAYQWQDLSTNASFTAWQPGTYWVRTTDGCGAIGHDTLVLTPDNSFQVSLGPDTLVCQGSSITLNAGAGQASYLWSNGASTPSISISAPGLYWVEVLAASGCYDRDTIAVDLCVGLTADAGGLSLALYPNPADEELYIRFSRPVSRRVEVRMLDALGRTVHIQAQPGTDAQAIRIPLALLAQGVYQVQVSAEGRTFSGKVVKR